MNPMLSSQKLLRLFVLLLLTVFVTESVYASGMMVATEMRANHIEKHVEHCHEHQQQVALQDHQNLQTSEKQQSHASCKECSHCFACFSIIVPATLSASVSHAHEVAIIPFVEIYHAPTSAQPQKPPIV